MNNILNQKRQEVYLSLIENLSIKNKNDFEACLNAHLVLTEICDNEVAFAKLIAKENIVKLIEAACDIGNVNQSYALAVLTYIIKEYPENERHIPQAQAQEFQQTVGQYFHDLTYSCIIVIRASDDVLGLPIVASDHENQAGTPYKRFGIRRMRALELLKQELHSISKYAELQAIQQISVVLRRHLVEAMLDVIGDFQFCSAACHEAIEVLDILKIAFDDEDIERLKAFVKGHLSTHKQTHFTFNSGRKTTNSNLASIIKIGIALKRLTTTGTTAVISNSLDDNFDHDSQSENNEDHSKSTAPSSAKSFKHLNDSQWSTFCDKKLIKFETKWTKKLESYTEEDHERADEVDPDDVEIVINNEDADEDSINIGDISSSSQRKYSTEIESEPEPEEVKDFLASNYWKTPEQFNIDDLLADAEL